MNKQMRSQIIAVVFILFIVIGLLAGLYFYMNNRIDYSSIDYIKGCQRGPNNFSDLAGSINVHSADDVGYKINGKYNIDIMYGDMVINIPKPAFFDEEFIQRVGEVGIEYKYKEDPETGLVQYRVTYWGEPIDEYSKVD